MSFTPAVSKDALKAMRHKIRKLRVRCRADMNIYEIAKWLNPMIQGRTIIMENFTDQQ
ncbi:hypothetical protein VCRA2133E348_210070 [Vibrio crassostreae]|nr:hypothetical protein VCRA2119O48_200073 [Vibrio crassostreae]CAK2771831.1 hypothetical protein VCRA2133E348_210070 [Vibrio crassostreae]CAK3839970.1 hypothetical protein VCRA212O16_210073 [Vibrio crassostreae]